MNQLTERRQFKLDLLEDPNGPLPEMVKVVAIWIWNSTKTWRHQNQESDQMEEINAQALTTILMNITLNVQAGLDCSSMKTAWDSLMGRYAQADPIVQNLTHAHLHANTT